jgi:predicted DsbA family dithiol-disulfide isomerase
VTRLEIVSDPICPWCYIGAGNLARALADRAPHPFLIRWRPFQLNPDMPADGMDRRAYLEAKFGGPENADAVYARIATAAREAGLRVDFARIARTPNTLDAHRLIHWAAAEDAQTRVAMALFRRYFEAGEDISDLAVLCATAAEAGLDRHVIARLLGGDTDRAEVRAAADGAQEMGVSGVPTFIVGGRYVITGAQPSALWVRVIDELRKATEGAPRTGDG